jgi:hypothetical protein
MNMATYPTTDWKQKLVFAVATVVIGVGALELVAGAMKFPDPETMAMRAQVLAAKGERASQLRALEQGELKFAAAVPANGF